MSIPFSPSVFELDFSLTLIQELESCQFLKLSPQNVEHYAALDKFTANANKNLRLHNEDWFFGKRKEETLSTLNQIYKETLALITPLSFLSLRKVLENYSILESSLFSKDELKKTKADFDEQLSVVLIHLEKLTVFDVEKTLFLFLNTLIFSSKTLTMESEIVRFYIKNFNQMANFTFSQELSVKQSSFIGRSTSYILTLLSKYNNEINTTIIDKVNKIEHLNEYLKFIINVISSDGYFSISTRAINAFNSFFLPIELDVAYLNNKSTPELITLEQFNSMLAFLQSAKESSAKVYCLFAKGMLNNYFPYLYYFLEAKEIFQRIIQSKGKALTESDRQLFLNAISEKVEMGEKLLNIFNQEMLLNKGKEEVNSAFPFSLKIDFFHSLLTSINALSQTSSLLKDTHILILNESVFSTLLKYFFFKKTFSYFSKDEVISLFQRFVLKRNAEESNPFARLIYHFNVKDFLYATTAPQPQLSIFHFLHIFTKVIGTKLELIFLQTLMDFNVSVSMPIDLSSKQFSQALSFIGAQFSTILAFLSRHREDFCPLLKDKKDERLFFSAIPFYFYFHLFHDNFQHFADEFRQVPLMLLEQEWADFKTYLFARCSLII